MRCNSGLHHLQTDYDERMMKMSNVGVWMGWSLFDIPICKFEMEQLSNACDYDLTTHRLPCALSRTFKQKTPQKAILR